MELDGCRKKNQEKIENQKIKQKQKTKNKRPDKKGFLFFVFFITPYQGVKIYIISPISPDRGYIKNIFHKKN
jgi:hypothetical protein